MCFKTLFLLLPLLIIALGGCSGDDKSIKGSDESLINEDIELDKTIGAYAEIFAPGNIIVEGFGIVAGLKGKGSAECPPQIREYLIKYIQQMLGSANRLEASRFLESTDNAVVLIYGVIPSGSSRSDRFDIMVEAISSSQTISLSGGMLYTSDLTARSRLGVAGAKKLATAEGPVFIDLVSDKQADQRKGRVIGGGKAEETIRMYLELNQPDFRLVSMIRNRINGRFGEGVAKAQTAEIITLSPPKRYRGQHPKFAELVKSLYIPMNDDSLIRRIKALTAAIRENKDFAQAEMGLEAIGRMSLKHLQPLLKDEDEPVRLRAARCMLNIGSDEALGTLIDIAKDIHSDRRNEAIEAIGNAEVNSKLLSPLRSLLSDDDFSVRYNTYELLAMNNDLSISSQRTMGGFTLTTVASKGSNVIYVSTQKYRNVVLFGEDIKLLKPLFVRSEFSGITANAANDDNKITVMRKNPLRAALIGPLECGFELAEFIFTLTDKTAVASGQRSGLGVDYSAVAEILKLLHESGNIDADLKIGAAEPILRQRPIQTPQPVEETAEPKNNE